MQHPLSIVMLGATGAVGNHAASVIVQDSRLERFTMLGRRPAKNIAGAVVSQSNVDVFAPDSYTALLAGHQAAVCTLGVGEPTKVSKQELVRVDRDAVLDFARGCKQAGVQHFSLLSSVAASSSSPSFFLRNKGQLEDGLIELGFKRLSLFHPSTIVTPQNRYGLSQAILLKLVPIIDPFMLGSASKFRSIAVDMLGRAIANNLLHHDAGNAVEVLEWADFVRLAER